MSDRVGQQLGNYRLTRLLGQGGFAEVYLGEHVFLGTTIAIKVLHTQVAPEDMAQFQQEAHILASLKHPHIVRILDFGIEERTPYLMMDYAPHGTLRTRHPRGTVLPVVTVVEYLKQVAQALQYAHERKIIHRDIKPENMLIGEKNEILLSDFGIALIAQSSRYQSTKDMAGTIAYMAPEQIEAHPRPASDQYSLGIVVYEWLCGTRPFHGSYTEIAIKHSVTPPPSLRTHLSTLSSDVEQVVLTALAKQPEERFASVSTFVTALEQASQDRLPAEQSYSEGLSSSVPTPLLKQSVEPLVTITKNSNPFVPRPVIQTSPALPKQPVPEKTTSKPTVSRRAIIIGAAGVACAAVGGGVFAILQQHSQQPSLPLHHSNSTHTPTLNPPRGTTLYTHYGQSNAFGITSVAWSPDGKRIASASDGSDATYGTVQVWDAMNGGNIYTYRGHGRYGVSAVAWSPNGKRIASAGNDGMVQVWDAMNGGNAYIYRGHVNSGYAFAVAWSPDGKRIASGGNDSTVQVWDSLNGGNVFTHYQYSGMIDAVAWSLDGKRIASGSHDNGNNKTAQVWDAKDGGNLYIYSGHSDPGVYGLAWSPDSKRIASAGYDKTVQVWNAGDGGHICHSDGVLTVAWSPDGKWIASGSADNTCHIWDATNGGNVFIYGGHSGAVLTVAWSPDGKRIASGSGDGTIQVWQAV